MPVTTILQAVLGSHGQGFATPKSDRDFGQVYVRPGREILHWSYRRDDDSIQLHEPEDEWGHELGKFVKLALNCNLTILELLFVPQRWVTVETWEGRLLRENGTAFLSRQKFHDATRGYATQQLRRAGSELRTDKARRHALRLIATGIHAHTLTGRSSPSCPRPSGTRFSPHPQPRTPSSPRSTGSGLPGWTWSCP